MQKMCTEFGINSHTLTKMEIYLGFNDIWSDDDVQQPIANRFFPNTHFKSNEIIEFSFLSRQNKSIIGKTSPEKNQSNQR